MRRHARTALPELREDVSPNTIFEMNVIKSHKRALSRLVDEALTIRRAGGTVLNQIEEYVRNYILTISVRDLRRAEDGTPVQVTIEPSRRKVLETENKSVNPWKRGVEEAQEMNPGKISASSKWRRRRAAVVRVEELIPELQETGVP